MSNNRNHLGADYLALSAVPPSAMSLIGAQRAFAEHGVRMDSGGVSAGTMASLLGDRIDFASIFGAPSTPGPVEVVMIGDFLDVGTAVTQYPVAPRVMVLPDIHGVAKPLPQDRSRTPVMFFADIHIADLDPRRTRTPIGQMREVLEASICGTRGNRQERRKNRSRRKKK